ncbi:MAG TPA: hypothetical protein VGF29_06710 [Hyphomicrobiaceae bacterium]|jgi:hypothetical protein
MTETATTYALVILFDHVTPGRLGIACLRCGQVSTHPQDVAERYCGACHQFHDAPRPTGMTERHA